MAACAETIRKLADIIKDYRAGEITPRDSHIIEGWVSQFPIADQEPLLRSLVAVFSKSYYRRDVFVQFLKGLAETSLSSGTDAQTFWQNATLLNIQQGGNSQNEILDLFNGVLSSVHGFGLEDTGNGGSVFIYLDDCIGTGNRLRRDLSTWLADEAPRKCTVHVATPVTYHESYWVDDRIMRVASDCGKELGLHRWYDTNTGYQLENRKYFRGNSDVLWPVGVPDHPAVSEYTSSLEEAGYPAVYRSPGNAGSAGLFPSDSEKQYLERVLLIRGCEIKQQQQNLNRYNRPLGFHNLECFGFGSMFVTYRNCPNIGINSAGQDVQITIIINVPDFKVPVAKIPTK